MTMALIFTLALSAFPVASLSNTDEACRGNLQGDVLHTTIVFDDGSRLIGPWQVMHTEGAPAAHRLAAVLHRVIEVDSRGAERTTAFPQGVAVLFEGRTQRDLIDNAAQVWCSTVLKARESSRRRSNVMPAAARITLARVTTAALG